MKKLLVVMMAGVFTTAIPAFALAHEGGQDQAKLGCRKQCETLLQDCGQGADKAETIQLKISRLEAAVKSEQGAREVAGARALQQKLDDARETLLSLEKA